MSVCVCVVWCVMCMCERERERVGEYVYYIFKYKEELEHSNIILNYHTCWPPFYGNIKIFSKI